MPTIVAAMTLVGLLRLSFVGTRAWELAFLYVVIVGFVLLPQLGWAHWFANVAGMFFKAWAWFFVLDYTDNLERKPLHWLILFFGFLVMVGSRAYLDLIVYQTF
jgi:hypothetical protein